MGTMASQITSLTIVYTTAYSDADQSEYQSSASLAFVRGIHRSRVNSLYKRPVTRKIVPFDDVIMQKSDSYSLSVCLENIHGDYTYGIWILIWGIFTRCILINDMSRTTLLSSLSHTIKFSWKLMFIPVRVYWWVTGPLKGYGRLDGFPYKSRSIAVSTLVLINVIYSESERLKLCYLLYWDSRWSKRSRMWSSHSWIKKFASVELMTWPYILSKFETN